MSSVWMGGFREWGERPSRLLLDQPDTETLAPFGAQFLEHLPSEEAKGCSERSEAAELWAKQGDLGSSQGDQVFCFPGISGRWDSSAKPGKETGHPSSAPALPLPDDLTL